MNKQLKQQILVVAFGVTLFAALMNLNDVAGFFRTFTGIFSPVFSGLLLAFILSVPKLGIARRLTGVFPRLKEKTVDALSLMACVAVLGRRELDRQCRGFLCAYFKEANGRAHLPRCKTDARHLYKVLFRPMHRGADSRHNDLSRIFGLPHSLCGSDSGVDRSVCLCSIYWCVCLLPDWCAAYAYGCTGKGNFVFHCLSNGAVHGLINANISAVRACMRLTVPHSSSALRAIPLPRIC